MAHKIACFLCGHFLPIKLTKKDKPVLICNSCGLQAFIRYPKGIERLDVLARGQASLLADFVVCHGCDVAVRRTPEKIQRPLIGQAGIYCPECDSLLLKASQVKGVNPKA